MNARRNPDPDDPRHNPRPAPRPDDRRTVRFDAREVRDKARGRWDDLLAALADVPHELTADPRGRPCPWCGGTDRFNAAADFAETGGVFCRQCFRGKRDGNRGDGFAAVMHARRCDFPAALAAVAAFLGLTPADGTTDRRRPSGPRRVCRTVRPSGKGRASNRPTLPPGRWRALAERFAAALSPADLAAFAARLGLPAEPLASLGVGWCDARSCHTFPMRDAAGAVTGIRTRYAGGGKKAIRGSREGLFLPGEWEHAPPDRPPRLWVCEGESDAAAALAWGLPAIGRCGCGGGVGLIGKLVERLRPAELVVLADNDPHNQGRKGADALAAALVPYLPVRVLCPPAEWNGAAVKDARDWFATGAAAADVLAAGDAVPARRLTVRRVTPPAAGVSPAGTKGGRR